MSNVKLKLLGDQVAIQPQEEKELPSGIVLPSTAKKDRPKEGVVRFVGPGKKDTPMEIKVGDQVIFGGWSDPTKIGEEEFYFVSQEDIKAVIQ